MFQFLTVKNVSDKMFFLLKTFTNVYLIYLKTIKIITALM